MPRYINHEGRQLRVGAYKKDPDGVDDPRYGASRFAPDELPPFVDLREHLTPVEDQGDVGSCTANALAGAYEYLEKRIAGAEGRVSRLFIYWNERDYEGATSEDHGAASVISTAALRSIPASVTWVATTIRSSWCLTSVAIS